MHKWRETSYRITKYNPDKRNEKGHYKVEEWTSISDIGKEFNETKFTYQDYISMEDKYITAFKSFANITRSRSLRLRILKFKTQTHGTNTLWD
jgi:hypothetical protein